MSRGRTIQTEQESWRAPDGTRFPERDLVKESITVRVFPHHFTKDGIPYDPWGCGFACGVKDAMGSPWAEIGKTIARIVVPDGKGGWECVRGRVRTMDKEIINRFDAIPAELTGADRQAAKAAVIPANGVLFTLCPITKSNRRDSMRAAAKRTRVRKFQGVAKTRKPWKKSQRSLNLRAPFRGTVALGDADNQA